MLNTQKAYKGIFILQNLKSLTKTKKKQIEEKGPVLWAYKFMYDFLEKYVPLTIKQPHKTHFDAIDYFKNLWDL